MTQVVEIGCGASAGPYFEGFDEHVIVDVEPNRLLQAYQQDRSFRPVIGDARNLDFLPNESVDVVLARNVFGAPTLSSDEEQVDNFLTLLHGDDEEEAFELMTSMKAAAVETKIAILREARRILIGKGQLIIVEQHSPFVAKAFFEDAGWSPANLGGMAIRQAELSEVTPANYARVNAGSTTWAGQRQTLAP